MEKMITWGFYFILTIALLSAAIILYQKAQASYKETAAMSEVTSIVSGAEALYSGQPAYTGLTNTLMINAEKIPDNIITDAASGTITNPWGGQIVVACDDAAPASGLNTPSPAYFDVDLSGLPKGACIQLATGFSTGNFQGVNINGTIFPSIANGGAQITPAQADAACSNGSNGNTLSFAFN